jgi:squalene-hopene/tetraprenyl-beta-curcumene cyclase
MTLRNDKSLQLRGISLCHHQEVTMFKRIACLLAFFASAYGWAQEPSPPDFKKWEAMVDKAIGFLRKTQAENGSWSGNRSPGITGVVVTGLLETGRVSPDDPMVARAIQYIESLVNPEAGHIAGPGARVQLQNYVTSVNVMALQAAGSDKYRAVVKNAAEFLKKLQFDEGEGKTPDDDFYGGAGYDSRSRPDMSNTQFFLEALKAAGVPSDDPAYEKALIFVSRSQNFKSEYNDRPWADKINDGSFIYTAAGGGETKVDGATSAFPGYGSMTYAGIKSMIYCGVAKDDPRMKKALEWVRKNYTLEANPGMPKATAERGLYYYYHTFAKALHLLGDAVVVDADGKHHNWRADLIEALAKRQRPDGSWVNENDRWMEGDPNLVTGYALMALAYCKPKP